MNPFAVAHPSPGPGDPALKVGGVISQADLDKLKAWINEGAVARWQKELAGPRLALIQWLLAPEMRHYGYQPLPISAADRRQVPAQAARELRLWL